MNWEVLTLAKLGKPPLPWNFLLHLTLCLNQTCLHKIVFCAALYFYQTLENGFKVKKMSKN